MKDFKCLPKMKAGGDVKAVVKKAFKLHDEQSHEGKKTDLSKLCGGGRAMKRSK